jgi:aspartyl-tRNA(Asn)/glutamyl-tRNA(Gln) amidotransferase subunit B
MGVVFGLWSSGRRGQTVRFSAVGGHWSRRHFLQSRRNGDPRMTQYELVVGLEIHAQLLTRSKMFCRCANDYFAAEPNTRVCPVCLGLPGALPVINEQAVRRTVLTGLALNCRIPPFAKFDRKNYFYPDLVKGYQISQYDLPLCADGWLDVETSTGTRRLRITRVHLEEDTGKLTHMSRAGEEYSLIDFNRSGVPLMEIVSYHDMHTLDEVSQYIHRIRGLLRHLGVSSGDMEKGAMRFEANISLNPAGGSVLGNRVEVKNLNSFRAVIRAIEYEMQRQANLLDGGGAVHQETMGWDEAAGVTISQRGKEDAHDYRYFPEPDLPPLALSREWVEQIRAGMPELPDAKRERFMVVLGLSRYDATLLAEDQAVAAYFETALAAARPDEIKAIANWILGEMFRLMGESKTEIGAVQAAPAALVELVRLVGDGKISNSMAKGIFAEMFVSGKAAKAIVSERGLLQISDAEALEAIVSEVTKANQQAVADYRAGKVAALSFLVGQVMKASRGRANPALAGRLLGEALTRES